MGVWTLERTCMGLKRKECAGTVPVEWMMYTSGVIRAMDDGMDDENIKRWRIDSTRGEQGDEQWALLQATATVDHREIESEN